MVEVWDRLVRIVHWSVASIVLANFLNDSGGQWHRYGGYLAAALVVLRLAWGLTSRGYARFSNWWPGLSAARAYLVDGVRGRTRRYLGINPLGALMACCLWTLIGALAITGRMTGLDPFWGEEWLEDLHETIAYILLACAGVHVFAVIATSIRQRENLPGAMITGKKRSS